MRLLSTGTITNEVANHKNNIKCGCLDQDQRQMILLWTKRNENEVAMHKKKW